MSKSTIAQVGRVEALALLGLRGLACFLFTVGHTVKMTLPIGKSRIQPRVDEGSRAARCR